MSDLDNNINSNPIIITSRQEFYDIDILACAVSLQQLLSLKNISSKTILPGKPNTTITSSINNWDLNFENKFTENNMEYKYIIVDNSDPLVFANFVIVDNVIEIYDHREGFKKFWKQKINKKAHIENVGSCATLIWEEFKKNNLLNSISNINVNLIITAIISNTLNFKASVTTPRDIKAYENLIKYSNLPSNWAEIYFNEVYGAVLHNPVESIKNDTKKFIINNNTYIVGQLELWDNSNFINSYKDNLLNIISENNKDNEFIILPNISLGYDYILVKGNNLKTILMKAIDINFEGDIGKTKKLLLRKEIISKLQNLQFSTL